MARVPFYGYLPLLTAVDAAQYFLFVARERGGQLNHRQLQNLLYYGQGFALVSAGKLLFEEPIEARREGVVIAAVAQEYAGSGERPLTLAESYVPRSDRLAAGTLLAERVVFPIYNGFGQTSCADLTQQILSEEPVRRALTSDGIVECVDLVRWWCEHLGPERTRRRKPKPVKLSEYLADHPELAALLRRHDPEVDQNSQP